MDDYIKRMDGTVEFKVVKTKISNSDTGDLVKKKQGSALMLAIEKLNSTYIIALDERGKTPNSVAFSKMLSDAPLNGYSNLCFVIGGAYGLSKEVLNACHTRVSFGPMVWPHRLVGLMLIEQIYRAQQINKGHPYHKA